MDAYETTIYTAVLITGVILGFIILFFALSVFRHQRKHIEMQRLYFLNEINLLEKERTRIARDLHDEIGPLLSLTKYQVNGIHGLDEKQLKQIDKTNENLQMIIELLGNIAINLTPGILIKKGLRAALEGFISDYSEMVFAETRFLYEVNQEIPSPVAIHLYRIIQELVHNAVKHSKATRLELHFKERDQRLYIFYRDNGIGFSTNETESNGIGLRSLKSRTGMLGGRMRCTSKPGEGTEYFIEIPLKQQNGN